MTASMKTLPLTVRVGVTNQLEHLPLKLSVTGHYETNEEIFGTAAGEFTVSPILKLRAGYTTSASDFRVEGNEDSLAGISAGLGISLQRFTIDYAFHSPGRIGDRSIVSGCLRQFNKRVESRGWHDLLFKVGCQGEY